MTRIHRIPIVFACALALVTPVSAVARSIAAAKPGKVGVVDHVADGDTFTLRGGDRVRILGIDAPEEYFGKHDCGSKPAAALLRRLLAPGTRVTLTRDSIQPNRDRYQRLLRYVGRAGVLDVGLAMIRSGRAGADPYGDGNEREGTHAQAAYRAKARRVGAWGDCHPLPPALLHTTLDIRAERAAAGARLGPPQATGTERAASSLRSGHRSAYGGKR